MNAEWLHWYYLIYLLPAAVAVLVLLMTGLGGAHGSHGHGAHGGLHLHTHAGHGHAGGMAHGHAAPAAHGHAGHAASGHAHSHGHHAHGAQHGHENEPSAARQLLGFFGVGRAPITIVVGSLMIGWGFCGTVALELLRPILHTPALFVGPSALIAAVGALLCARLFGTLAARVMPQDESYAITREGLLGLTGKVVYAVTEAGGRVHVFDQFRTLHAVSARVAPGVPPLEKGTEVIVASMDPEQGFVLVEPLGFTTSRPAKRVVPAAAEEQPRLEIRNRQDAN